MSGSGKTEVAKVFEQNGFRRIRFGDLTDKEIIKRGLELNEENERQIREQLRREHGMAAYAKLALPEIESALKQSNVVIDGLYSWEEYKLLKEHYGEEFFVVAVYSSPKTRQLRLSQRAIRPLTPEQLTSRDFAEIENINKAGPIVMADFTIINESSLEELKREAQRVINKLREGG